MSPEEKANLENYEPMSKHGGVVWDTPITNAAQFRHPIGGIDEPPGTIWVVESDIAAGLERQVAELVASLERISADWGLCAPNSITEARALIAKTRFLAKTKGRK